ncbi:hypothetical protein Glove_326g45 [Diversispora epigaea]|uniref:Uncharacterized protein n=1 Tax=Diversispora epigaea TaxID=1348612 RepID=A0A397HM09_9GLOM|nr:hypothetical protein Glove_326g45 [Diversispora epigaea]
MIVDQLDHQLVDYLKSIDRKSIIINDEPNSIDDGKIKQLINEVYALFKDWEKLSNDLLNKIIEILCQGKGITTKDLLTIFEENVSNTADYFVMGFMNELTIGKTKDLKLLFEYYSKGAELALNNVWCYDIGFGVSVDPEKVFKYFELSAEKGYATAGENGCETARKRADEVLKKQLMEEGVFGRNYFMIHYISKSVYFLYCILYITSEFPYR